MRKLILGKAAGILIATGLAVTGKAWRQVPNETNAAALALPMFNYAVREITSTYTVDSSDHFVTATSGTFTLSLPAAADFTGWVFELVNEGAGTITIDPYSTETIQGELTASLLAGSAYTVVSLGDRWRIH